MTSWCAGLPDTSHLCVCVQWEGREPQMVSGARPVELWGFRADDEGEVTGSEIRGHRE